ncbi:MAG: chemotaxis protein [Gammaproteobacteria bacterium]|nr:chemotaxis protein [Rhodocyclaceae bacterium]MBU3910393.1 chemotaxis protein [Gammaproteobacteria bacterium]MBU4004874.1 chemotaxis protein [Gammaproteobacteria bacterium]MBU4020467.1 chemotaxis protein [Gammaproteobacteria bacterium]MBU4095543.1 chemotaxis protein [Gammaproteobacteria bacterium]
MPALIEDAGRELRRIVRINEEIKTVVARAFKTNLMAMNAIFLAKRAGQSALGFGVLSNELRQFAMDLQKQMAQLREMTHGSVAKLTALLRQARLSRVFERTRNESTGTGRMLIDEFMKNRQNTADARQSEQIAAHNRRLTQMIADTAQLAELGGVLARSAKIEAAYGGPFSAALTQVSSDFERTIGEIQHSLSGLGRQQVD